MTMKPLALALLIPFLLLTIYAVLDVGYFEIFLYQFRSSAGWQVIADLVVALILVCCWILVDAKKTGRNPWPYLIATLFVGSIAPLLYFALAPGSANKD